MKPYITCAILIFAALQIGCKVSDNRSFIKKSKQSEIILKGIAKPYIVFVLEKGDTIRFSTQDVSAVMNKSLKKEIDRMGYSSTPHLAALAERIKAAKADIVVYQNLSAVDFHSISGNLDIWIARELLLAGQAEVSLTNQQPKPASLKYVYTRDILGGEQGTFYTCDQKAFYKTIISLGE